MKLKAFIATLFVAGLAVSVAIAAPPPGKGHRKGERDGVAATSTDSTSTSTEQDKGKGKGKGRGKRSSTACRPTVSFVLKGEFVSATVGTAGEGSFAMLVNKANKHGRQFVDKQVTIETGSFTKMKRRGPSSLASLAAGDRLVVQVRACKTSEASASTQESVKLYAKRVVAHPKSESADDDAEETTTTTKDSTTSTGETTTAETTTSSTTESTTTTTTTSP